ncbi:MAG: hypothetical protein KGY99_06755 [Phycisphaerae bacterium]|nr:hypothetical protein [Phycisphaerae bacterium]
MLPRTRHGRFGGAPAVVAVILAVGVAPGCKDDADNEPSQRAAEDAERQRRRPAQPHTRPAGDTTRRRPLWRALQAETRPDPSPSTRPAAVTSAHWPKRYRYHNDMALSPARDVIVVDVRGDDGAIHREARLPDDPTWNNGYTARLPVSGDEAVVDSPGSREIHVEIDPDVGRTDYAGLTFTVPCTLAIDEDGTLRADSEGLIATDEQGRTWRSTTLLHRGRDAVVFLRPQAPPAPRPAGG